METKEFIILFITLFIWGTLPILLTLGINQLLQPVDLYNRGLFYFVLIGLYAIVSFFITYIYKIINKLFKNEKKKN